MHLTVDKYLFRVSIQDTMFLVRRNKPQVTCFFSYREEDAWKTMLYIQLWIMNLNQFNNPSKGVFAFHSLSLIVAIESTQFSITYIFIFQWVLKDFQSRARDRECSWRLPPPGNYVTPWFNSSWHFPHCTFCSSSNSSLSEKQMYLLTTQGDLGNGYDWSCVELKKITGNKMWSP